MSFSTNIFPEWSAEKFYTMNWDSKVFFPPSIQSRIWEKIRVFWIQYPLSCHLKDFLKKKKSMEEFYGAFLRQSYKHIRSTMTMALFQELKEIRSCLMKLGSNPRVNWNVLAPFLFSLCGSQICEIPLSVLLIS